MWFQTPKPPQPSSLVLLAEVLRRALEEVEEAVKALPELPDGDSGTPSPSLVQPNLNGLECREVGHMPLPVLGKLKLVLLVLDAPADLDRAAPLLEQVAQLVRDDGPHLLWREEPPVEVQPHQDLGRRCQGGVAGRKEGPEAVLDPLERGVGLRAPRPRTVVIRHQGNPAEQLVEFLELRPGKGGRCPRRITGRTWGWGDDKKELLGLPLAGGARAEGCR
mmetsp:Transcript_20937/g.49947  ORF Transcript_20937/g.49947 Transcript_20937/m.49947 type:complete len:220 (-) Transcript_20937:583-1242(-)